MIHLIDSPDHLAENENGSVQIKLNDKKILGNNHE